MTDDELIACTNPPQPLARALMEKDEEGMGQLLALLFACHAKVDETEDESPWHECEVAWDVKQWYERGQATPALLRASPNWEEAMRVSEAWLGQWRHTCGEFERWKGRRHEIGDPSALAFFRGMMIYRCPKLRKALVMGLP